MPNIRVEKYEMKKSMAIVSGIAIGVTLFVLSLVPAEVVISRNAFGPSESYILKGLARLIVFATGLFAFASGAVARGLWSKWRGRR